jgi:hypothetical protein
LVPHPSRNPLTALTPVGSPVHEQHAEITDRLNDVDDGEPIDEDYDETAELVDGEELPAAVLAPDPEPDFEPEPQAQLASVQFAVAQPRRLPKPRSAPGLKAKAAFTLRLDPERHLKLRLACAVKGRSAQMLVTDAVDRLLADMPELDSMAEGTGNKGESLNKR